MRDSDAARQRHALVRYRDEIVEVIAGASAVVTTVPDRFVFGFGMDVRGAFRNLPGIYAMKGC